MPRRKWVSKRVSKPAPAKLSRVGRDVVDGLKEAVTHASGRGLSARIRVIGTITASGRSTSG
jgi:hypothetical protein